MMKKSALALLILLFLAIALSDAAAQNRTALLVANGNYANFGKLANPVPEARALKAALERLGFQATLVEDASREAMVDALADFEASLKTRSGIAFFHYGGHGVQVGGKNYLIPANAEIPDEKRVASRCVDLDEVMAALDSSGSDTNIVVLDACRNNPLPASAGRSASRGLAVVGAKPRNSIIVYAAESGNVAQDGLFTPALTRALGTPGLSLGDVVMQVRREVFDKSKGAQTPGAYDQLFAPVYLAGAFSGGGPSPAPTMAVTPAPQPAVTMTVTAPKKTYGSLAVTATSAGTLYLDGVKLGDLPAEATANLGNIETGSRKLELRYAEGAPESRTVTVTENQSASVSFSWKKAAPVTSAAQPPAGAAASTGNFVRLPGGSFMMGSPEEDREYYEIPQHKVTVSAFSIGQNEVTVAEFREFVNATGYKTDAERDGGGFIYTTPYVARKEKDANWKNPSFPQGDSSPVVLVSWFDAAEYCNWRSKKEGLAPAYTISGNTVTWTRGTNGYRLPTEAEWEYACRAGTNTGTSFGNSLVSSQANFDGNESYNSATTGQYLGRTAPVGSYPANAWGLYDMHGNVAEWCWDWFALYDRKPTPSNPTGPASGDDRVVRGGSWRAAGKFLRSANRSASDDASPSLRFNDRGFRVAR